MKTYCEVKTYQTVDWNVILQRAIAGEYDEDDLYQWSRFAASWVTCACGNQCDKIPRDGGEPRDSMLFKLGTQFYTYVSGENWLVATATLRLIEARSSKLLAEIEAKEKAEILLSLKEKADADDKKAVESGDGMRDAALPERVRSVPAASQNVLVRS